MCIRDRPYSSPRTFSALSRNAVRSASSSRSFARICSVSAPSELKCLASWLRLVPTLLHWASKVETAVRVSSPPPATMTVFSILTLWMARRMKVEMCIRDRFKQSRHGDGGFACGGYSLRAGGVGPVSYTHLDVYKRQLPSCPAGFHLPAGGLCSRYRASSGCTCDAPKNDAR